MTKRKRIIKNNKFELMTILTYLGESVMEDNVFIEFEDVTYYISRTKFFEEGELYNGFEKVISLQNIEDSTVICIKSRCLPLYDIIFKGHMSRHGNAFDELEKKDASSVLINTMVDLCLNHADDNVWLTELEWFVPINMNVSEYLDSIIHSII
jgi:hypothetical protein